MGRLHMQCCAFALAVLAVASATYANAKPTMKSTANKLHCRYDVSNPKGYWYKHWRLTTGCKPQRTTVGGVRDPTIADYYKFQAATRGEWFNVVRWANKSSNCAKYPKSTTCMSCSMNMPRFAIANRVVPFGVYDGWWLYPEPGATCGMCYKMSLPQGKMTPRCAQAKAAGKWNLYETYPECPGNGNSSYLSSCHQPWAWNARVYRDKATGLPYIIGINVEWYDLDSPLEYGVSYLTQGKSPEGMGSWPLIMAPIACPVGNFKLEYAFVAPQNASRIPPVSSFFKLQIAGQRIQLSRVEIQWQGERVWYPMTRSGNRGDGGYGDTDGHWQVDTKGVSHKSNHLVNVRIFCSNGHRPKVEKGINPAAITCKWQDPKCVRMMGKVQC